MSPARLSPLVLRGAFTPRDLFFFVVVRTLDARHLRVFVSLCTSAASLKSVGGYAVVKLMIALTRQHGGGVR